MTIFFDMDGTIANLYSVPNWLNSVRNFDPTPYKEAEALVRLSALAKRLNNLQKMGYKLGIISWLSKESTPEYDKAVTTAKMEWLKKHLKSVEWDTIHIVPYGTPKANFKTTKYDFLLDDEQSNLDNWGEYAFDATEIFDVLDALGGNITVSHIWRFIANNIAP